MISLAALPLAFGNARRGGILVWCACGSTFAARHGHEEIASIPPRKLKNVNIPIVDRDLTKQAPNSQRERISARI
jgi:hypothetical protein